MPPKVGAGQEGDPGGAQRACTGLRHITVRHIREQIEQVLFTDPGDRVFRPEFGAGVRRLVFEPNSHPYMSLLWTVRRVPRVPLPLKGRPIR